MRTLLQRSGDNLLFWCPGCGFSHPYDLSRIGPNGKVWTFNGDMQSPTFTPSLMVNRGTPYQCHLFVTSGMIQFCADCAHALKGQTVAMVPWEQILGGDMDEQNQQQPDADKTDPAANPPGEQQAPGERTAAGHEANVNEALRKMAATPIIPPAAGTTQSTAPVSAAAPDPSKLAGGPLAPDPKTDPIPVDPAKLEEAIAFVMSHKSGPTTFYTREEAEKIVAQLGVDRVLMEKQQMAADNEQPANEGEKEEEAPDGAEHMKKCTACGTWATKGEMLCPQCSTAFPVVRA